MRRPQTWRDALGVLADVLLYLLVDAPCRWLRGPAPESRP